jgi:hypothetical protein
MSAVRTEVRSARLRRALARAPRVALLITATVLSLAGLRAALEPRPVIAEPAPPRTGEDLSARALAERFARAYLEHDPARPEAREATLAALAPELADELLADGPAERRMSVDWTQAAADRRQGETRLVTVAAGTSAGVVHLALAVQRDPSGLLRVAGPPAIVGEPPVSRERSEEPGEEIEDPRLGAVVERAVRNYLAGERRDLAADLATEAVVSLPTRPLRVESVERSFWIARPRLVAVEVRAGRPGLGTGLLRYRLEVARRGGRWQVISIGDRPVPTQGGRQ